MADAKFALEVAASGGHHLLLDGPPGSGKTSLAERLPGILPDLTVEEALELTAVHSLAGVLDAGDGLITRPPFLAPHHTSSRTSLLGGGTGKVRPGELSRAHCGVLLLDEFPLFATDILDALRQPLEAGEVTIARGEETATYPARGMFVLACNPCPCGNFTTDPSSNRCTCLEVQRRDYRRKLGGPVMDRIDITRRVRPVPEHEANDPLRRAEPSTVVRARVTAARRRAAAAVRRPAVAAQRPGPRSAAAGGVAAEPARSSAARQRDVRRPAHPPRRHPGAPAGLDGGRPRAESTDPGWTSCGVALRLRSVSRWSWPRSSAGASRDPGDRGAGHEASRPRRPATPSDWPGSRSDDSASPATRGWPGWWPSSARSGCTGTWPRSGTSGGVLTDVASRLAELDPARDLERAERLGIRFVVPGDDEWPTALDDLDHCGHVQDRGGSPLGLWVRGTAATRRARVAGGGGRVALRHDVRRGGGRRDRRAPGRRRGHRGVRRRVRHRPGRAPGCAGRPWPDRGGAGLRGRPRLPGGAQAAARPPRRSTVRSSPSSRPGCSPTRLRFLSRNRLIAGLSRGTVIVEAAVRSGALNTAHWTERLSRPLMGVPGPVTSAQSQGVHQLLRTGASLVTRGAEVAELVGVAGEHLVTEERGATRPATRCDHASAQVLDAVPVHQPAGADSIARTAGIGLVEVQRALVRLHERGLVERLGSAGASPTPPAEHRPCGAPRAAGRRMRHAATDAAG